MRNIPSLSGDRGAATPGHLCEIATGGLCVCFLRGGYLSRFMLSGVRLS